MPVLLWGKWLAAIPESLTPRKWGSTMTAYWNQGVGKFSKIHAWVPPPDILIDLARGVIWGLGVVEAPQVI